MANNEESTEDEDDSRAIRDIIDDEDIDPGEIDMDDIDSVEELEEALGTDIGGEEKIEFEVRKAEYYDEFLATKVRKTTLPQTEDVLKFDMVHEYDVIPQREELILDLDSGQRIDKRDTDVDYIREFRSGIFIPVDAGRSMIEFMLAKILDAEFEHEITTEDIREATETLAGESEDGRN